jgi:putative transposase
MAGTYTNLLYYVVFSTKRRVPFIGQELQKELYAYVGGIVRGENGILLAVNGTADHIHLLAKFKADRSVSDMLRKIKANSSKWVNETGKELERFAWQDGYAAFSVSESQVGRVKRYIRSQEEHHRRRDFKSELLALLQKHHVEYDERYLWD